MYQCKKLTFVFSITYSITYSQLANIRPYSYRLNEPSSLRLSSEILQAHSSGLYTSLWIAVLILSICVTVSPNSMSSANLMRVIVSSHFIVSSQPMTKWNITVTAVVLFLLLASTAVRSINHYFLSYHPTWTLYEWSFFVWMFQFFVVCLGFLLFFFSPIQLSPTVFLHPSQDIIYIFTYQTLISG